MKKDRVIRIGTRGSKLALTQTKLVIDALKKEYKEYEFKIVILHTKGDKILNKPLIAFGGKGVFITEFEEALLKGEIDLAVHSAKDMPMEIADGLTIAGVLPREDARDVLVTKKGTDTTLPILVGTGSLRRQTQLLDCEKGITCIGIRGNVPTRLKKIENGECDGVVLAAAGLKRLGCIDNAKFDYHYFSYDQMIPAAGQGIIAMEARMQDVAAQLVRRISDKNAFLELQTERYVLKKFQANCYEAVGAISVVEEDAMHLRIMRERNGSIYRQEAQGKVEDRFLLVDEMVEHLQD